MVALVTAHGRFVVNRTGAQTTTAELLNAKESNGRQWSSLPLKFPTDCRDILVQGFVPKIYGGTRFVDHQARIRGCISHYELEVGEVMTSVVYLELLEESEDSLVTYVFRLDGAGYSQRHTLESVPMDLSSVSPSESIRIQCQFRYLPSTKELTISPPKSSRPIHIPENVVPHLIRRLRLDAADDIDGPYTLVMIGSGVIEGQAYPHSEHTDAILLVPDVITFDCGIAIHRLWLKRSAFRWFIDEKLEVAIR